MSGEDESRNDTASRERVPKAPGTHPVGIGIGAVLGGAAAGAVTGTAAGPMGALAGAAVGALVGGLAGKGVAEAIDPTREDAYWRNNFADRSYVRGGSTFDDYGPAYGYGVQSFGRYPGRVFDDVEPDLSRGWDTGRGSSSLSWDHARHAVRDAWNRVSGSDRSAMP
jgi:hypothetical protein